MVVLTHKLIILSFHLIVESALDLHLSESLALVELLLTVEIMQFILKIFFILSIEVAEVLADSLSGEATDTAVLANLLIQLLEVLIVLVNLSFSLFVLTPIESRVSLFLVFLRSAVNGTISLNDLVVHSSS